MATHSIQDVDQTDDYYHVRFRDPDEFDEIRTPDWAEKPVLVPTDQADDEDEARNLANEIVEKIES